MRKVWIFLGVFLAGCSAGVKDWKDAYKYIEPKTSKPKETVREVRKEEEKDQENLYRREVLEKLSKMIHQEPTPLAMPPTILRVFVLPYVDQQGRLITQHYIYLKVDEGKWILGDYLLKKGSPPRELHPLRKEDKNEGK